MNRGAGYRLAFLLELVANAHNERKHYRYK